MRATTIGALVGMALVFGCAAEGDTSLEEILEGAEDDGRSDGVGRAVANGWIVCPRFEDWPMQCPTTGLVTLYSNQFWNDFREIDTTNHVVIKGRCEEIDEFADPMHDNRVDWQNYACQAVAYTREREEEDKGPFYILGRIEADGMEPGFPYADISPELKIFTTKTSASGKSAQIFSGLPTNKKVVGTIKDGLTFKYDNSIVWGPWNRTSNTGTPYKTYYFRLETVTR